MRPRRWTLPSPGGCFSTIVNTLMLQWGQVGEVVAEREAFSMELVALEFMAGRNRQPCHAVSGKPLMRVTAGLRCRS